MRVQRKSSDKVELVKRIVDKKPYYTARLYDDFKTVENREMNSEGTEILETSYDCEMVITQSELEFVDDTQAMYFFETNFDEEFRIAKYIEEYKRRLDESMEAKQLLDSFDYVPIKMSEAAMKVLKNLYRRRQEGATITFDDFLDEFVPTLLNLEKDKGDDFFGGRDRQRAIAAGRN